MMKRYGSIVIKFSIVAILAVLTGCQCSQREKKNISRSVKSADMRVADRNFPSVFQAWNPADNLDEDPFVTLARHDLVFHSAQGFKLVWNNIHTGLADGFTSESINEGLSIRGKILELNPNMIILIEIRYRDAPPSWLPEGHQWWMRDSTGNLAYGWKEGGFIRLALDNPDFQERVAAQAAAAVRSGVADGVMLDWWNENEFTEARLSLLKKVREAIGKDGLIIVNSNDRKIPESAAYVNGLFMECYGSNNPENWEKIRTTLLWAEANLRTPRINCLETWFDGSRNDSCKMRATTTLTLTHSDGYCLFSDPNSLPVPDHLHNWYTFWDTPLGKPSGQGFERADGSYQREYEGGTVIYNPVGSNPVSIKFSVGMKSMATGLTSEEHSINTYDGDIFVLPDR